MVTGIYDNHIPEVNVPVDSTVNPFRLSDFNNAMPPAPPSQRRVPTNIIDDMVVGTRGDSVFSSVAYKEDCYGNREFEPTPPMPYDILDNQPNFFKPQK